MQTLISDESGPPVWVLLERSPTRRFFHSNIFGTDLSERLPRMSEILVAWERLRRVSSWPPALALLLGCCMLLLLALPSTGYRGPQVMT